MKRFSERLGLIEPRAAIQKDDIDDRLRNRLWNTIREAFLKGMDRTRGDSSWTDLFFDELYDGFLGIPRDNIEYYTHKEIDALRGWALKASWNEFYDLTQFLGDFSRLSGTNAPALQLKAKRFMADANTVLEAEKSAFRFVNGELVPISDELEIASLERAVGGNESFAGAREHMRQALKLYADRSNPDYRNSIKEAISSIESAFTALNGGKSKNLSTALKLSEERGLKLHPALKGAISQLYGWTSDEGGIRHAFLDQPGDVGEAQARLMLVLCSGLLNFLTSFAAD